MNYIVWNPYGPNSTKEHRTEQSARYEARRLAVKYPGHIFHVMETKSIHQLQAELINWWPNGNVTVWPRKFLSNFKIGGNHESL